MPYRDGTIEQSWNQCSAGDDRVLRPASDTCVLPANRLQPMGGRAVEIQQGLPASVAAGAGSAVRPRIREAGVGRRVTARRSAGGL